MDDIAERIAARDRVRRRVALQMTAEERIMRMRQLHEWGLARLAENPSGLQNFIRRNLTKRAISRPHAL